MDVGVSHTLLVNVNREDAVAAQRALFERIGQRMGHRLRVNTTVFDDPGQFRDAIAGRTLHLAVMDAWQFLECEGLGLQPAFVPADADTTGRRFVVVARRGRQVGAMADLRGRTLVRLDSVDTGVCRAWLRNVLPDAVREPEAFFGRIEPAAKVAAAVLPVFFGQKDACLVDERGFELMCELNPQVGEALAIVARSERLVDLVVCFGAREWDIVDGREIAQRALATLAADAAGRQILALFKVPGLVEYRDEQLATVRALRRAQGEPVATTQP
jgi:phosphonate transport system substrate-binding protein